MSGIIAKSFDPGSLIPPIFYFAFPAIFSIFNHPFTFKKYHEGTVMPAPDTIHQLVEKFHYNLREYKNPRYSETQVRVEFINPFWDALGWDVLNKSGSAMAYRDVIHEAQIKVGGTTKAPDYAFKVGKERVFFLEAKKPSRDLKHDPEPAFQLRRYAWSAKLPVSMLTDFEELGVYDTRIKPAITDKSHVARRLYYTYDEYVNKWDEIAATFSKEAVLRGAYDRFIESGGGVGKQTLDRDFLNSLDEWRIHLARNIALRNTNLTERELNFAVQKTIDRLIFLRMAEDRGIEPPENLRQLVNGENSYKRLVHIYYKADARYNSGLFHFEDKDGDFADLITPGLTLDDKVLKEIIKNLYYPCPYEFSQMPVEVLGNAYEQFLGKRISLTSGHRAKIEEKPEVRKAGGVYYTPQYIVDYIVEHTVGELLREKSPKQASALRILDPACGSGSFLLGAYQYLLDWHLKAYISEYEETGTIPTSPQGQRSRKSDPQAIFQDRHGQWTLTTAEKKRILLNNIYGVDIDSNAVEVTKLSLLLKVLEHENSETLGDQKSFQFERALPNLSGNIKCGNSLIGPDYNENQQSVLFDEDEMLRVNVFDWHKEFADVFAQGGFDAVIGNPPYIRIQAMKEWAPTEVEFYKKKYKTASKGNYDIYVVFVEKGLKLLKELSGVLGFILPHKFMNAQYGEPLRSLICSGRTLNRIIHFNHHQVFSGATTYTCLMFLQNYSKGFFEFLDVVDLENWKNSSRNEFTKIDTSTLDNGEWKFLSNSEKLIFHKMVSQSKKLAEKTDRIFQGFKTGADPVFILQNKGTGKYFSSKLGKIIEIEKELIRPLIKSGDIKRFSIREPVRSIIFPYKSGKLIPFNEIKKVFPKTARYLLDCKKDLEAREGGKWKGDFWYGYSRSQALQLMEQPKLLTADLNPHANFALDDKGLFCFTGGAAGGYGILTQMNKSFLLGLLNSKLLDWYLKKISTQFRGGWYSYESRYISELPIKIIKSDKISQHDRLVSMVQHMLDLHTSLAAARDPRTREQLTRQIQSTDTQIDCLVYELYELSEEEINIIES